MLRDLVGFALLVVLVACLAPGARAEEEEHASPAPSQVAAWILDGGEAELERAVDALRGAPRSYVEAVLRRIRAGRPPVPVPADTPPDGETATVHVTARVYAGRRGLAKRLLGEGRMRGSHLLTASEAGALVEELEVLEHADLLHAPSLVVADRQWATISLTTPFSWVKSFDVQTQGGNTIKNPVLGVADEGLVLEIRPRVSEDGTRITLAGALTQTTVERPIRTQEVGGDEVQVPVLQTNRFDLHVTAPDGGTVLGAGLSDPTDTEREQLILLTVHRTRGRETVAPEAAAGATRVVTMGVRLLNATPEALRRALGDRVPDADATLVGLEAEDVVRLLGPGRRGSGGVEIVSAPRLTTYDGQRANVSVLNQTAYVRDYTVEKDGDSVIVDPVIDVLQDGLVFEVTPRITADRTRIGFETLTTWAVLTRPIADFTTTIEGREVTIQIPELRVNRVRNAFDLQAGGYALIGGFGADDQGRHTCVLLHAFVTDLEEEELELLEGEDAPVPNPR